MLKLRVAKAASRFVKTRPLKHQKQIVAKIQSLREDPSPSDSKLVKGSQHFKRADVGEYRVVYRVEDDALFVAGVGKRNDDEVFRRFGRKQGR